MPKTIMSKDGKQRLTRVSRWITLKHNYNPSKRNSLWDYVCDENGYHPYQGRFNPENGLYLDYFRFNGRTYALEQFYVLGGVWTSSPPIFYDDEDGKLGVIGTVDMGGDLYHSLYAEWDEYCEHVRLWEVE